MDKTSILRNLEFLDGGMTAIYNITTEKDNDFKLLIEEWRDIIYSIIDEIEEDESCQEQSKNLLQ
jgi:hypothetical protein